MCEYKLNNTIRRIIAEYLSLYIILNTTMTFKQGIANVGILSLRGIVQIRKPNNYSAFEHNNLIQVPIILIDPTINKMLIGYPRYNHQTTEPISRNLCSIGRN